MRHELEHKIQLNENTQHSSLYSWCLNEIDKKGDKIDNDWIPFVFSLYFTAKSLTVFREVTNGRDLDNSKKTQKIRDETRINGSLLSGVSKDGKNFEDGVIYSMFGTDRKLESFDICIYCNPEGNNTELCDSWGYLSFETEDKNFIKYVEPDIIGFQIFLNKNKFDDLVNLIESKRVDDVILRVNNVAGFYSNWSPTISTNHIKILTNSHKVKLKDKSKVELLTLGSIGEFNLSFQTNYKSNLEFDSRYQKSDDIFQESEDDDKGIQNFKQEIKLPNSKNLRQVDNILAQKMNSLKVPLWLIFIALVLILIK